MSLSIVCDDEIRDCVIENVERITDNDIIMAIKDDDKENNKQTPSTSSSSVVNSSNDSKNLVQPTTAKKSRKKRKPQTPASSSNNNTTGPLNDVTNITNPNIQLYGDEVDKLVDRIISGDLSEMTFQLAKTRLQTKYNITIEEAIQYEKSKNLPTTKSSRKKKKPKISNKNEENNISIKNNENNNNNNNNDNNTTTSTAAAAPNNNNNNNINETITELKNEQINNTPSEKLIEITIKSPALTKKELNDQKLEKSRDLMKSFFKTTNNKKHKNDILLDEQLQSNNTNETNEKINNVNTNLIKKQRFQPYEVPNNWTMLAPLYRTKKRISIQQMDNNIKNSLKEQEFNFETLYPMLSITKRQILKQNITNKQNDKNHKNTLQNLQNNELITYDELYPISNYNHHHNNILHSTYPKLIQFYDSYRPAWFGKFLKKSTIISSITPLAKDYTQLNYDINSDDEWGEEEPEDAEELASEDEKDNIEDIEEQRRKDGYEEDGFVVPESEDENNNNELSEDDQQNQTNKNNNILNNKKRQTIQPHSFGVIYEIDTLLSSTDQNNNTLLNNDIDDLKHLLRFSWIKLIDTPINEPIKCNFNKNSIKKKRTKSHQNNNNLNLVKQQEKQNFHNDTKGNEEQSSQKQSEEVQSAVHEAIVSNQSESIDNSMTSDKVINCHHHSIRHKND